MVKMSWIILIFFSSFCDLFFLFPDFSTKLNEQKVVVDEFKEEIGNKFRITDKQIKTQKMSADQQRTDIDTLKNDTAGM